VEKFKFTQALQKESGQNLINFGRLKKGAKKFSNEYPLDGRQSNTHPNWIGCRFG